MRWPRALTLLAALALLPAVTHCNAESETSSSARFVTQRSELIGGDRALGDIGDVLLENDQVRLVIQQPGYSRGFGVYGGSLIDADLRRPAEAGASRGGKGFDSLGEVFSAFFIQAVEVDTVEILADGSDGGPARVSASGGVGDFLELLAVLNRAITGSNEAYQDRSSEQRIRYETIYELEPGRRSVKTIFRVKNISEDTLVFPAREALTLLKLFGLETEGFTVPLGDVALFGATNRVFIPGVGYDVRFGLQDAYARNVDWPAFPGIVTELVAARNGDVSYGMIADESERNYVWNKRDQFESADTPVSRSSMLVPFVASSFLGIFYDQAPDELAAGDVFETSKHFVIGHGDIGSVLDEVYAIRGTATGDFGGTVLDDFTGAPAVDADVLVYERSADGRRILSEYQARTGGHFKGKLPPGEYSARVTGRGRPLGDFVDFSVKKNKRTGLMLTGNAAGRVVVQVRGERGEPLPAKATLLGTSPADRSSLPPRKHLFDLQAGESFRATDLIPDDPDDPESRRYIEGIAATQDGSAAMLARPGKYDLIVSRGPEYDLAKMSLDLKAGQTVTIGATLKRVVDTRGWIAADTHLHSKNSIDSGMDLDARVRFAAAEGVEWGVSTDHNYVSDLAQQVARNNLRDWYKSAIGLELTTLESGHFNAFPLEYRVGPITHGSFEWSGRPPGDIFSTLRSMGRGGGALVSANHPRDTILGYFDQYNQDPLEGEVNSSGGLIDQFISPSGPAFKDEDGNSTFSRDFDLMEVVNGRLYWEVHHFRVPERLPPGELPEMVPPPGTVVLDSDGEVAFAGVVDDWYNLLNQGERKIGVGASDSHEEDEEAGYFRTMVYVGEQDDNVSALTDQIVLDALKQGRAVATNGPLLSFYVNDRQSGMLGSEIQDADGSVRMHLDLTAAPWISVSRINIVRNGVLAKVVRVNPDQDLAASPLSEQFDIDLERGTDGAPIDSWFVVEAIGYRSYFPVVRPLELPPLLLTDAVGSLAGPLGFDSGSGALQPAQVFPISAYAITNPIWVKTGDGPWRAPGVKPREVQLSPDNDPGFDITASGLIDGDTLYSGGQSQARILDPLPGNPFDIRNVITSVTHCGRSRR